VNGRVPSGSWSAQPGSIHVHGTRGALRILHYANKLYFCNSDGLRQIQVANEPMPANFSAQMLAFVEAIGARRSAPVPGEVGAEAIRTLLQIYSSAAGS
jgi:predicted dehydrogenase